MLEPRFADPLYIRTQNANAKTQTGFRQNRKMRQFRMFRAENAVKRKNKRRTQNAI